jgi:hypothetical protein
MCNFHKQVKSIIIKSQDIMLKLCEVLSYFSSPLAPLCLSSFNHSMNRNECDHDIRSTRSTGFTKSV